MQPRITTKSNFTNNNRAKLIASLWTLLILFLCFIPGQDLPRVNIPLADKWAHMVLFGIFTILWHRTVRNGKGYYKLMLMLIAVFIGWLVEYVQGHYIPNRSQDNIDTLADGIGGAIGIVLFWLYQRFNKGVNSHRQ
jgi:VanZ family protein